MISKKFEKQNNTETAICVTVTVSSPMDIHM